MNLPNSTSQPATICADTLAARRGYTGLVVDRGLRDVATPSGDTRNVAIWWRPACGKVASYTQQTYVGLGLGLGM